MKCAVGCQKGHDICDTREGEKQKLTWYRREVIDGQPQKYLVNDARGYPQEAILHQHIDWGSRVKITNQSIGQVHKEQICEGESSGDTWLKKCICILMISAEIDE